MSCPNRDWLRAATRSAHDAVDARVSALDLARADGLAHYVLAVESTARGLDRALTAWPDLPRLEASLAALEHDLAALRQAPLPPAAFAFDEPAALGALYTLAGSHFGKAILARRRAGSTDPAVRRAGAFFADDTLRTTWDRVLVLLAAVPADDASRPRLVAGAVAAFSAMTERLDALADGRPEVP